MTELRSRLQRHRGFALCLVLLALALRLLVPVGYMPAAGAHGITITLCSGTAEMTMPMPGMAHHGGDPADDGTAHAPCPYASVAMPTLAGGDPIAIVAPATSQVETFSTRSLQSIRLARTRLRPPGRAPPPFG